MRPLPFEGSPRRASTRRTARVASVLLAVLLSLAGCGGGTPTPTPSPSAPAPSPTHATAAPTPAAAACYALTFDQALAPTAQGRAVPCAKRHTTETYAVGRLDTVIDGHLVAVDSAHVRDQVARACPARLARFLGGTADDLRLSMLRPVWFTPTVEQSDAGAQWYRCDVIAIAGPTTLLPVTGHLKGALADQRADDFAMCSTAEPGTAGFTRVPCQRQHSWKALRTVPLPAGKYPGEAAAKAAGQTICRDAGRTAASDALDYQWGYEWPTAQEWRGGQTYGICWAPD